eukprot:561088-Pleurochrysis_carterae.AAC.1
MVVVREFGLLSGPALSGGACRRGFLVDMPIQLDLATFVAGYSDHDSCPTVGRSTYTIVPCVSGPV